VIQYNSIVSCYCSGDPAVESLEGTRLVFVGVGLDPFETIPNSIVASFVHATEKTEYFASFEN
jgi:hypothetical protein